MTPRTSRELLIAAAALAVAFAGLTIYVRFAGPIPGDAHFLDRFRTGGVPSQPVADLRQFFGTLGTPVVGGATTIVVAVIAWRRLDARAAVTVLVAAAIVLVEAPLADVIGHTDAAREVSFPAGGYPSGHALYATAVLGAVAALWSSEARVVAVILWVGMCAARVTGGTHLFDEVLGAMLLGGAWLCLVLAVARR